MSSQFSYTVIMMKMKLLAVVTPPSIYHKDMWLRISNNLLLGYDLVCFQYDLDDCIMKLHQLLDLGNIPVPQESTKENINKDRGSSESKITLKNIELFNQYDIELYKWAVSQFRYQLIVSGGISFWGTIPYSWFNIPC